MAYGKWIGAWIGGALGGGILGALAGFALGSIYDMLSDDGKDREAASGFSAGEQAGSRAEGERNGFLFSMMVLSAHIIQADDRIMHSEMEFMRRFLRQNFGESAAVQGEEILLRLFDYHKRNSRDVWDMQIQEACAQMRMAMPEEHRMQLLAFLMDIAKADGRVDDTEIAALRSVADGLGLPQSVFDQMFALGGNSLDDAYKVLGLSPEATDEEVRNAYRSLVRKHHPDRVATLGDDVKEAAKKKMQEINDAKERIYKARGL